ncbi:interphotoreceptor matrix proteoglycan 2-like [Arapaima gigas]
MIASKLKIRVQPTLTKNDLKWFLTCSVDFANYNNWWLLLEVGSVSLSKKDPNCCHQHGEFFSVKAGPIYRYVGSDQVLCYGEPCQDSTPALPPHSHFSCPDSFVRGDLNKGEDPMGRSFSDA